MSRAYDLVVIGAGTAAMVASMRTRAAGWSVAVVDARPFGGTCALRGCDPKKLLLAGAATINKARHMTGKGVAGTTRIDWPELMSFKRSFTDPVPSKQDARYREKGIDTYRGKARFTGPNSVDVQGTGELRGRFVLLASGVEPVRLGIPGEEFLIDNEGFLSLQELPARIVMVGGGYIAAEFSNIASLAGAQVTVLQHGDRMLKNFEPELVGWLMESFRELGIDVRTGAKVEAVEKIGGAYKVHASIAGNRISFDADAVVHAAGRAPRWDDMGLDAAGIATVAGRISLNEFLQSTSNPAIYAAGDAAQAGPPLTPVSSHDGKVVAHNMVHGNEHRPNYHAVPSVAFTLPPIAAVGMGEAEARKKGLAFRVKTESVPSWFTARQSAERVYGYKVMVSEADDQIIGAHIVGPHADEVINIFALAMRNGLTADAIKNTMFAYPTGASDLGYML